MAVKQAEEEAKKKEKEGKKNKADGWMEKDKDGVELLNAISDPLLEAAKYVRELETFVPLDTETFKLSFEVALRRQKYLMALRAVKRAMKVDRESPEALMLLVRLVKDIEGRKNVMKSLSPQAREVLEQEGSRKILGEGTTLMEYVEKYASRNVQDTEKRMASGLSLLRCAKEETHRLRAMELLTDLSGPVSVRKCEQVRVEMVGIGATEEDRTKFDEACRALFPKSNVFAASST